tara:strand:- start:18 stop:251 length:234 start_codon:yes stop_codon:yes gene_type:complete
MAKKITVQDLHKEVEQIKNNHLTHMMEDIDDLKDAVKENRIFFTERLDRLDNRIFVILGLAFSTLASVIVALVGGMI